MSESESECETDPAVSAALEAAAAALRADLAARGVRADELPEAVVLALAAQQERIEKLEEICRILHRWVERLSDGYSVLRAERFPDLSDDAEMAQAPIDLDAHRPPIPGEYPPEAPRWRHDCPDCVFLGRSADGGADLYYCQRTRSGQLIARHGDQVDAIHSTNPETAPSLVDLYPHLAEAHRRAAARGLVGGAGEGEGGDSRLQQLIRDGQIGPR
jgi:hypothetical protein